MLNLEVKSEKKLTHGVYIQSPSLIGAMYLVNSIYVYGENNRKSPCEFTPPSDIRDISTWKKYIEDGESSGTISGAIASEGTCEYTFSNVKNGYITSRYQCNAVEATYNLTGTNVGHHEEFAIQLFEDVEDYDALINNYKSGLLGDNLWGIVVGCDYLTHKSATFIIRVKRPDAMTYEDIFKKTITKTITTGIEVSVDMQIIRRLKEYYCKINLSATLDDETYTLYNDEVLFRTANTSINYHPMLTCLVNNTAPYVPQTSPVLYITPSINKSYISLSKDTNIPNT